MFFMPVGLNIQVRANDPISYTFEREYIDFSEDRFNFNESFNVRNQTEYSGHYPAMYSFENETGLTGIDIPFVTTIYGSPLCEIVEFEEGHEEVLHYGSSITNEDIVNIFLIISLFFSNSNYCPKSFWW